MTRAEILKIIDDWANFYLWIFGDADHMNYIDNGVYAMAYPKEGHRGINSVFNIRLEHLDDAVLAEKVAEIKALGRHTWWNQYSERVTKVVFPQGRPETTPDSFEVFAVMLPENKPIYSPSPIAVREVKDLADFTVWCGLENRYEYHDSEDLHPQNHYHHLEKGTIRAYIAYDGETPIATSGMMNNGKGIYSLEFVSTADKFRQRGFATAACQVAIDNAFKDRARMVTVRAYDDAGKALGLALGFAYI